MRTLAILLGLLLAGPAWAQKCPGSNASLSFTLPAPMSFAVYDFYNTPLPGLPAGVLTVLWQATQATTAFVNVPQTTASSFQTASNQTQFYQTRILNSYHSLLIEQGQPNQNCPLLGPDGVAPWTR
jgi:hypothetical protein